MGNHPDLIPMLTIGAYMPLAGTGCNTVRMVSPGSQYEVLQPGHKVHMEYRDQPDGELYAEERLVIAGIAFGSLPLICNAHSPINHGVIHHRRTDPSQELAHPLASASWLMQRMKELYGPEADEARFCAIYFR